MFVFVCLFVPRLVNQHIDNLFSLWAASIDKHIASLAARHCASPVDTGYACISRLDAESISTRSGGDQLRISNDI